MEILRVTRRIFQIFGICSLGEESDFRLKLIQMSVVTLVLSTLVLYEWFSVLYFVEHLRIGDIENTLISIIQVVGVFSLFSSFFSLNCKMKTVSKFFDTIQNLFDQCMYRNLRGTLTGRHLSVFRSFPDEATPAATAYLRVDELCEFIMTWIAGPAPASFIIFTSISIAGAALIEYIRHGFVDVSYLHAFMPLKLK